jgi:hypothetical protein
MGGGGSPFAQPSSKPSPFEADKARKEREEMSAGVDATATLAAPVPMVFSSQPTAQTVGAPMGLAVAPQLESSSAALDVDAIRGAVLVAMQAGGSQLLVNALEEGNWTGAGNVVSIAVDMSESMIELSYTKEQEKFSDQAASRVAGQKVKVRLVGGGPASSAAKPRSSRGGPSAASGSIKTKAAEEPVVQRMMEKFGAEIRIVMDRSER